MIRSLVGRRALLAVLLIGFVLSFAFLAWVGRGGAISFQAAGPAIKKLLEHYVPLLAILAGFYFSERAVTDEGQKTSVETFMFASVVVGIWALAAPVLIAVSDTIEAAMRILETLAVIGTSLTSASLVFYFSKSAKGGA